MHWYFSLNFLRSLILKFYILSSDVVIVEKISCNILIDSCCYVGPQIWTNLIARVNNFDQIDINYY